MPFKRLLARLTNFLFIVLFAKRAARKLRSSLPLLGMTQNEALVIASPGVTCGQTILSGFTTPIFRCEVFIKRMDGWVAEQFYIRVGHNGLLTRLPIDWETASEKVEEDLSFFSPRAQPVVAFLKSISFAWPFTIYMVSTPEQILARQPALKG